MHKVCSRCKQDKPIKVFCKAKANRDGLSRWCNSCFTEWRKQYREKNKEKITAKNRAWTEANKEYFAEYNKTEKAKQQKRTWRKNNADKVLHLTRIRQIAKLKRTPSWLTEDDKMLIQKKYALARKKTELTGERWVVDHILPLQGEFVSGLHVPANLRVIKGITNSKKSNKFVPV